MTSPKSSPVTPLPLGEAVACSVNVAGHSAEIAVAGKTIQSGHFKRPTAGAVRVEHKGLVGDLIVDQTRHGGPDQAVYLFSKEDCQWWSRTLSRSLGPGDFGENLTVEQWWPEPRIGDRLHFDEVTLEITFPRIPCATLAARFGDQRFVKTFAAANRPGLYARVLRPGRICAGAKAQVVRATEANPSASALFRMWLETPRDRAVLAAALRAPIAQRARVAIETWLAPTRTANEI